MLARVSFSLRQGHLELDLRQLLRRLADLAQERQPARVGVDLVEQVLRHDLAEPGSLYSTALSSQAIALPGLATEGVDDPSAYACLALPVSY